MKEEAITKLEARLVASLQETVKITVNGKIDRLSEKLSEHIDEHKADMLEIRPFIQGVAGAKILGSGLKWVAGIAIAYMTIRAILTGVPL